ILFGRARDFSFAEKEQLNNAIKTVIQSEFGNFDLPILANVDFGHTDPQIILPLGVNVEINIDAKTITQTECAFQEGK
ncbi:MAG: LD-carboxypeptidase, partial [Spirochaetota bacterium]